jgi:hypothetical protein
VAVVVVMSVMVWRSVVMVIVMHVVVWRSVVVIVMRVLCWSNADLYGAHDPHGAHRYDDDPFLFKF